MTKVIIHAKYESRRAIPPHCPCRSLCRNLDLLCFWGQSAVGEMLTIPGSGNPEFVLSELATAFNARQSEHRVVVPHRRGMPVPSGMSVMGLRQWVGWVVH
jgi:hypothetical protein